MRRYVFLSLFFLKLGFYSKAFSLSVLADTSDKMTLDECIEYAMSNFAGYQQSKLDQEIADRNYKASMASWLPQVRTELGLNHYFIIPTTLIPSKFGDPNSPRIPSKFGVANNSNALFQLDQTLFSNDVLLAYKAGKYSMLRASQNTTNTEINVIVNVTKAFYDVLITQEQLAIIEQDIVRQQKLYNDAYSLYESGVSDKIDYKRTSIALNNSLSNKKRSTESLNAKSVYLKQLMGYPMDQPLVLEYDKSKMENEIRLDTNQMPDFDRRIEYQLLKTQKQLQELNTKYYKNGFLPTVTAFINYNFYYQSQTFSTLYNTNYPNSLTGVKAVIPLFTGGRRHQNVQISKLQVKRLELDQKYFKDQAQTEYARALGSYKSNLNDLRTQQENLKTAQEVYDLVKFQYEEGIKAYVDVITTESDLRNAEVNYLNALYNTLSSKMDVEKAMGTIIK